jgi:hypothetical protein
MMCRAFHFYLAAPLAAFLNISIRGQEAISEVLLGTAVSKPYFSRSRKFCHAELPVRRDRVNGDG